MAWGSPGYFPVGYQPYNQMQQMMTPPTIRAEIVQVDNEQAAAQYPVGAGASQMMIARDDSAIFVKTAGANGQTNLDVFVKRAPKPAEPPIDLNRFVTREEFEQRIAQLNAPKEVTENEPV